MVATVNIADRILGPGHPCFIIAEAGVNHNGDLELAEQLIDIAVESGADAVKFQTFKAERVISPSAPKAAYQLETTGGAESQLDMIRPLELPAEAFGRLQSRCHDQGIIFISSPFDHESISLLDGLGVPAFKVPSGEIVNTPYLRAMAKKGKPIILSTGMSDLGEVEAAIRTIHQAGNQQLVVLHCVSNYPADPEDVNLNAMQTMAKAFNVPVGFSDHTLGIQVPLAAVAIGACVIEKHFTLDQTMAGPDHRASLEPSELKELVDGIRKVERSLGDGVKRPAESEENTKGVARRSIFLRQDVKEGSLLKEEHLIALRPAGGIPPNEFDLVLGRTLRRAMPAGSVLSYTDLQ